MLKSLWSRKRRAVSKHRVQFEQSEFECSQKKTILEAALDAGVALDYSCQVGACGACRCRVVDGQFERDRDLGYILTPAEQQAGITLACQSRPLSDLVIERAGVALVGATVTACRRLDAKVVELRLEPHREFTYRMGQSVNLRLRGTNENRFYSMVDLGDASPAELVFHIKLRRGGLVSSWLESQLGRSGAEVELGELSGKLPNLEHTQIERVVVIAGGSGMGVAASVARRLSQERRIAISNFVVINRTKDISPYHREVLQRWTQATGVSPKVDVSEYTTWCDEPLAALSAAQSESLASSGAPLAVLCGSGAVVDAAESRLARCGWPGHRVWSIRFDERAKAPHDSEMLSSQEARSA